MNTTGSDTGAREDMIFQTVFDIIWPVQDWDGDELSCRRVARQVVDAILASLPAAEGEWQPIETAPKDGTEVNGYRPDQGVFTFRWAEMVEFVPKDMNGDPAEEYDDIADWFHDRWGWMQGDEHPTHWRPLPAPPGETPAKPEGEWVLVPREQIRVMAKQRPSSEMDEEDQERADWQGAYDWFVGEARAMLSATPSSDGERGK